MHAFDRRIDKRTDRILIARPRLHSMQRGKKLNSKHKHIPLKFSLTISSLAVLLRSDDPANDAKQAGFPIVVMHGRIEENPLVLQHCSDASIYRK